MTGSRQLFFACSNLANASWTSWPFHPPSLDACCRPNSSALKRSAGRPYSWRRGDVDDLSFRSILEDRSFHSPREIFTPASRKASAKAFTGLIIQSFASNITLEILFSFTPWPATVRLASPLFSFVVLSLLQAGDHGLDRDERDALSSEITCA